MFITDLAVICFDIINYMLHAMHVYIGLLYDTSQNCTPVNYVISYSYMLVLSKYKHLL